MRRWVGIIGIAIGIVAMHSGKWAAYAYCRLQMTIIMQQADCDCAKYLTDDEGASDVAHSAAAGIMKPSSESFGGMHAVQLPALRVFQTSSGFAEYTQQPAPGTVSSVFRPPAFA